MTSDHLLFISAGAHIHDTYSVSVEHLKPTHVFVLVEEDIYREYTEDSEFLKEEKPRIRQSIELLERKIEIEGRRSLEVVRFSELDQDVIRDEVLKVCKQYPDAAYSFNVTAGTALFSTSLFLLAVWLGGRVCITRTRDSFLELKIPKMSMQTFEHDHRLKEILLILGEGVKGKNLGPDEGWVRNKEIFVKRGCVSLMSEHVKCRDKVFQSRAMNQLKEWGLIEVRRVGRDNAYRLTGDGIFANKILKSQGDAL